MAKQEENKSSGIPLLIIGAVLIAAVVGGWYWFQTTKSTPTNPKNGPTAGNTLKATPAPVNAPLGASPPNMLGSPTSLVTVEEFADFQCGSCAAAHPTMKEIQSIYGSRIKFIFRNYPLAIPAHDKSYDAATAAEAAGMQGRFWDMQNQLFTNQAAWTQNPNYRQLWADYAQRIGINVDKWQADIAGLGAKARVDLDLARGRALSVSSTPTIFVNGASIPFPEVNVTSLRQIIDAELQKTAAQNQPAAANAAPASNSNSAPASK
jgi:protein-disulfide isomerase